MYLRHSLLIAALLVALCRLQVCSASYRIYIRQLELQSIFNNTSDSDAVEGGQELISVRIFRSAHVASQIRHFHN